MPKSKLKLGQFFLNKMVKFGSLLNNKHLKNWSVDYELLKCARISKVITRLTVKIFATVCCRVG